MLKHIIFSALIIMAPSMAIADHSLSAAKKRVDARFTYKNDPNGLDIWVMPPKRGKFSGDCEEYAMAVQREAGGRLWGVILSDGTGHVILCKGLSCADNLNEKVFGMNPDDYLWMMMITDDMRDKKIEESANSLSRQ